MTSAPVVVALTGVLFFAGAQTRPQDGPAPAGTSTLAGVVMDAATPPQPVNRAVVMLAAAELPEGRAVLTDERGQFSFERLPAGRYTITANKAAYLGSTFGADRPGGTGSPVPLAAGARVTDLRMTLAHGGAIAGTVRNSKGEPIPTMLVSVTRVSATGSTRKTDNVYTDDRGNYRAFGLMAGRYTVSAAQPFSGGQGEVGQMSSTDVDAAFAKLRQQRASGTAPAKDLTPSPSSIVRPSKTYATVPLFHGGATTLQDATVFPLGLGEERLGIDIVFQLVRALSVSGTLVGDGMAGAQVSLMPAAFMSAPQLQVNAGAMQQRSSPGTFRFTNVTPGPYVLFARTGAAAGTRAGGPAPSAGAIQVATANIDVSETDVEGVVLALQPAITVTGRFAFEPGAQPAPDGSKFRPQLFAVGGAVPGAIAGPTQPDGSFTINGVAPVPARFSVTGAPAGWRAKSAVIGNATDQDLFDAPVTLSANTDGLVVTFTSTHTSIAGKLQLESGAPVSAYLIVAFPVNRALWTSARRLKSTRPGTDGQYAIDDLPAGEYFLASITDVDADEWQSLAFLGPLATSSVKITLVDGETKTQSLAIRK